ncbi:MAG: carboxypeptidase regulatory-like domain-containing protein [Bryobacteraceae bacterium]
MLILGVVALLVLSVAAQCQTADLTGVVRDATGSAVPGAHLTITRNDTRARRSTDSDRVGVYSFPALQAGVYDLTVEAHGFGTQTHDHVVLDVGQHSQLDFVLAIGVLSTQVKVYASGEALRPADASVGTIISGAEIAQLPVNGRNFTRLILLIPGASSVNGSQSDGTVSGTALFSVNGERDQDNNYVIDGIESNFFHGNSPGALPPMDSIAEFRVTTGGSAEFGRSMGANVSLVTKSGSNTLHGTVYEYLRNADLDANDFFANASGLSRTPYHRNQFGATAGGPVVLPRLYDGHNRTFWFTAYEGFRASQGTSLISTVPTAAEAQGNFNGTGNPIYDPSTSAMDTKGNVIRQPFPNNTIPAARLDPGMQYMLQKLVPRPNLGGLSNNYLNTQSAMNRHDIGVARVDQYINSNNNVFFRILEQRVDDITPKPTPQFATNYSFDGLNVSMGWTSVLNPSSVLDITLGYNGLSAPEFTTNTLGLSRAGFLQNTGIQLFQPQTSLGLIPTLAATGAFSVGESGGSSKDNVYQLNANFSHTAGKLTWKSGLTFSPRRYFHASNVATNGTADFTSAFTQTFGVANSGGPASLRCSWDIRRA